MKKFGKSKKLAIPSLVLITAACIMDIPIWPTFCQEQIASSFVMNYIYMILLPVLCCNTYVTSILMLLILFSNVMVRRHVHSETGIYYADVILLLLACISINVMLMRGIAECKIELESPTYVVNTPPYK